ncbi:MAG TPA: helix-turn-helix transcriptional regulator [Acidothermaceae bacterium]
MDYTFIRDLFAAETRAEMARRRITQTALASSTGINRARLQSRLTGQTSFPVEELVAVAQALGLDAAELVERVEARLAFTR